MADLRVLLITPDFPPAYGGIQVVSHRLASEMPEAQVTVVTLRDGPSKASDFPGISVRGVHVLGPRATRIAALNAAALTAAWRTRPDVVLSLHVVAAPAAALASHLMQAPLVQYLHAAELPHRPRLVATATQKAHLSIAVSRYTRDLAVSLGAPRERIRIIHPGIDPPHIASRARARDEGPLVVSVSALRFPYKGHDVLIRAFPLVRARMPGAKLMIIGDGSLRPGLQGLIDAQQLSECVTLLGALEDSDRDAWLQRAQVFALVSRLPGGHYAGEGFGIAFMEAAAHGLPVVGGDVGGARDAVIDGATGLLVDPTEHVAVADAISKLLLNPDLARRYGQAGATRAANFTWPLVAQRVRRVLAEAFEHRR